MVIGITGQSGAGKTTASHIFKKYGFIVLDADIIARNVINNSDECKQKIKKEFGDDTVCFNGSVNSKTLASRAFEDRNSLCRLNSIVHPCIFNEIKLRITKINRHNNVIIDAAALWESGCNKLCNYIIAVTAPKKYRLDRIIKRDKISKRMALKRINAQENEQFYTSKADFTLGYTKDITEMTKKLEDIINQIGGS